MQDHKNENKKKLRGFPPPPLFFVIIFLNILKLLRPAEVCSFTMFILAFKLKYRVVVNENQKSKPQGHLGWRLSIRIQIYKNQHAVHPTF